MSVRTEGEVREWMIAYVARLLGTPEGRIDPSMTFEDYGLDSTAAAGLTGDLGDWLGCHLEANLTKEFRSIDAVTRYVTTRVLSR